jgi:hypothetical protein
VRNEALLAVVHEQEELLATTATTPLPDADPTLKEVGETEKRHGEGGVVVVVVVVEVELVDVALVGVVTPCVLESLPLHAAMTIAIPSAPSAADGNLEDLIATYLTDSGHRRSWRKCT